MASLWIFLGIFLAACSAPDAEPAPEALAFQNANTEVAFVGDAECATCHEERYQRYQDHGMARSMYRLTPDNTVEDFSGVVVPHPSDGFYYRVYREGDRFFQEEYRLDAAGRKTHQLVREMKWVIGSGSAARTYFTETNQRFYELPLTWYTQTETWAFSPGYDVRNGRFDRTIPDRCMACHNSYPQTVAFVEGKYDVVPDGIGCERCHGPGDLHVEERLANPDLAEGEIDLTIVNPAHLPLDLRLDVCQQCHLNGEVSILREGRTPFDFRPSQPLVAHVALFAEDHPKETGAINVISHADRMKQSACFIETRSTPAPMDCVTCHDPHEGFRTAGPAYFNSTCMGCHTSEALQVTLPASARQTHTAEANCIMCHMPKVATNDAPHASFTDHKVRVVETGTGQASPPVQSGLLKAYFPVDEGTEGDVYRAMAEAVRATRKADTLALGRSVRLLREAVAKRPTFGEAQYLLGFALYNLGRFTEAIPVLETAVKLDPDVPERLNTLAQAYEQDQRGPEVIGNLYQRALAIQPSLGKVRVNYGRFLETQDRLDEAIVQYRQAAEESPWLPEAHYNLGTAYIRKQQPSPAEDALETAIELKPNYTQARSNLGILYASQGKLVQAEAQFKTAVDTSPNDPVALSNLGTLYLNQNKLSAAVDLLERSVAADERHLDGLVNLALAYVQTGNDAGARRYAAQALQVRPGDARAQQILDAVR